ncbi:YkgB family protein [Mycolicibacterium vinylchloridicum]|uniref:YkgB family protein n=1 Tax=Mycolicibacterium vinylchloridicum TaxID=2736928 RepID=UPI001C549821|nr:DUF417 family protein [Mycolicibacterium vinylchloridicum]
MAATQLSTPVGATASAVSHVGALAARYGLVVVISWIGALKFTSYEAQGIQPLVANSPFMSWIYGILSVDAFSTVLGVVELATAILLAVKPWSPKLSVLGSVMATGLFLATISFLFTTPGVWEESAGGFPALSSTGQFLIKDVALIGVAVWTLGDALSAVRGTTTRAGGIDS